VITLILLLIIFSFSKTTGNTHRIVAELIDLGVENNGDSEFVFDNSFNACKY
jgi:hypothetical protein